MFPFGARQRDRHLLFVLVLFVYPADREYRSLIIYLKMGPLTLHKVTADYLSVGQKNYPLGSLTRRRKFWTFLKFALFSFVARSLRQLPQRSPLVLIFWRNKLCAFLSSGGLRLAGPNEDGFPSIRRLEQTQLEDFHLFEGWFSLESCIDSKFF